MEVRKKHQIKLWTMFVKYLIVITVNTGIIMYLYFGIITLGVQTRFLLPANYAENQISLKSKEIAASTPFDSSLIPANCKYGLFDKSYHYLEGDFDQNQLQDALGYLKNEKRKYGRYYKVISRQDELCIIQYDFKMHFSDPSLGRIFKAPEAVLIYMLVGTILIMFFVSAVLFARKLKKQLLPLMKVAEKIKEKDLEFDMEYSRVKEFNDVLNSMDEMRSALSESLKREWEMERKKSSHISALAHDIKTPLTVIKGNAQLLLEEDLPQELREYAISIDKKTDTIESYIKLLIDTVKNKDLQLMQLEEVQTDEWIRKLLNEAAELAKTKKIKVISSCSNMPETIYTDKENLSRAVMNIVKNGIEYATSGSRLKLQFTREKEEWEITVEDEGEGFTEKALKYASCQFYTQKEERSGEHYGLGLYIADQVAKGLNGKLIFYNKEEKGAVIKIILPLKNKEI